ncbi:MAG: Ser/Thr protein kinase RdoA (MazF antagonist) [Myxococcota bacterium]|jgi:Ser/Thr protein kinase RdoA (MazF antagonist)
MCSTCLPACLPPERARTITAGQALLRRLRALPQSPETFGIAHSDLHQFNFFRSPDGRLLPFDFDDCEYSPFIREVSIPLYYALGGIPDRPGAPSREAFGEHFLVCFLRGFQREVPLSRPQLTQLPAFLQLRSLILMSVLCTSVPGSSLRGEDHACSLGSPCDTGVRVHWRHRCTGSWV